MQAWDCDEFEVQAYWGEIERNTDLHIPDAYQTVLDDPLQHSDVVWRTSLARRPVTDASPRPLGPDRRMPPDGG
jgi:hypothetical protein